MPDYKVNYDDPRLTKVTSQEKTELTELEKSYGERVNQTEDYYNKLIDNSQQWADKQTQIQNEQTQFTIDKIEQQKAQAEKDYTKEQSGAYTDWQKQSNPYGVNAEQQAASGLRNTGFSESSQVSMYNTYQNRVATAREVFAQATLNYDNGIREAKLQNSAALAQIAFDAYKEQAELALQSFQYKNQLLSELTSSKMQVKNLYASKWQTVLSQIQQENELAENARQHNAEMAYKNAALAEEKRQHQAEMAYKNAVLAEEKQQYQASLIKNTGGGGGGKPRSTGSATLNKVSALGSSTSKAIKGLTSNKNTKNTNTKNPPIDTRSLVAAGFAGASAATISKAVDDGILEQYVEGGMTKFRKTAKGVLNDFKLR